MALREQFTTSLRCPECSQTGYATWEENDNPFSSGGDAGTMLKSISGRFRTYGNVIAQPAGGKAQICWKSGGGMTGLTG